MKKTILTVLLVVCLVSSVSIVGFAQEDVTLRVCWWGSQTRHDLTLEAIKLFERKNPNIKIRPEYTGWGGYFDRMAAQAAGGGLPDVMQQDYKFFVSYYRNGLLLDLEPLVGDIIDLSNVDQAAVDSGRVDGVLCALSLGSNTYAAIYDPEVFAEAGITEPTPDWTWEDYMDICRQIKGKLDIYAGDGLLMATANISGLEHYVRQHGQTFYNETNTGLGFEDRLFIEFYEMDMELTKEGVFTSPEIRAERHTVENDLIVTGKSAMANYWSNQLDAITRAAGRQLKMNIFPNAKNQTQYGHYLKPSMFWSITTHSEHPEAAAKFIDFFTNDVEANLVLMGERGVPISSKVRERMARYLGETQRQVFSYVDAAAKYCSPIDPPPPDQYNQVIDTLEDIHFRMLYGLLTPEEGAREFRSQAERILAENK